MGIIRESKKLDIFLELENSTKLFDEGYVSPHYISLDSMESACIGDVTKCSHGVTWLLQFDVTSFHADDVTPLYLLTSPNIFVRQNFGFQFEVGLTNGSHQWLTSFDLLIGSSDVILLFSFLNDLYVYIDGFIVSEIAPPTELGVQNKFWIFSEISVGSAKSSGKVNVKEVLVFEEYFSASKIGSLQGN